MALPASGSISLNQVNVELKKTGTTKISMGDTAVRALAKKTSGAISMSDLRGKSSEITYTNTTNRKGANIHTLMGKPTAKGVYIFTNTATISASAAGGTALSTGAFPAGSTLRIINRGAIRGGGGNGGRGDGSTAGAAGGTALILNFPTTIDNTGGTIWGGGGGGGGATLSGGGGGAGTPGGAGGAGAAAVTNGKAGSSTAGGAGGVSGSVKGGTGGAPGAAGGHGVAGTNKGAGGRGGYSVQRNGHAVTWAAVGDRKGSVV